MVSVRRDSIFPNSAGLPAKEVPMRIIYHGHSEFTLINSVGTRVLTDPCDPAVGYGNGAAACDVVTVSHGHHDHCWTQKCPQDAVVLNTPGLSVPAPDVQVELFSCFHDDAQGTKRGENLLAKITMDGIHVLHCGDLGHELDEELLHKIGKVDVLLVPVGGFYTIDDRQAAGVARALNARVVIPMHYKTQVNADWPIGTAEEFMDAMNASRDEREEMPTVRITREDLSEQKHICLLQIKAHA